jgi:hypothetical protein
VVEVDDVGPVAGVGGGPNREVAKLPQHGAVPSSSVPTRCRIGANARVECPGTEPLMDP